MIAKGLVGDSGMNLKYILITLSAVALSWMLHEFFHWGVGELLGNEMTMTLNSVYPTSRQYTQPWHANLVSAAGPAITLLQAIIFYFLLKKRPNKFLFPFLLTCFYMRLLAGILNFINLNDEGRISRDLGMGTFTLPLLMIVILSYLTYNITKAEEFNVRFIIQTTLLVMLFSSLLILTDQALGITIL